jgi:hypothetical protein
MAEDTASEAGGVHPYPLPLLGTTWLDRGPRYWARRAALALGGLLFYGGVCALYGWLSWAFVLHPLPRPWRLACAAALGLVGLGALGLGFTRQWRKRAVPVGRDEVGRIRLRGERGTDWGRTLAWLCVVVSPAAFVVCAYTVGQLAAVLPLRRTPAELGALEDYERRLAAARTEARGEIRRQKQRRAPRNGPSWR